MPYLVMMPRLAMVALNHAATVGMRPANAFNDGVRVALYSQHQDAISKYDSFPVLTAYASLIKRVTVVNHLCSERLRNIHHHFAAPAPP